MSILDFAESEFQQAQSAGQQTLSQAQPEEVDAHRSFLSEALQLVENKGGDAQAVTQQAGTDTSDPQQMSHSDLISTTLSLARSHPQIVQEVASRFPQAQGVIQSILGGSGGSGGGIGGLLGNVLG